MIVVITAGRSCERLRSRQRQTASLRASQLRQDDVPRQRMAERETRAFGHHQLQSRAPVQGSGDLCALDSGHPAQQPPVKAATENRRGACHHPLAVLQQFARSLSQWRRENLLQEPLTVKGRAQPAKRVEEAGQRIAAGPILRTLGPMLAGDHGGEPSTAACQMADQRAHIPFGAGRHIPELIRPDAAAGSASDAITAGIVSPAPSAPSAAPPAWRTQQGRTQQQRVKIRPYVPVVPGAQIEGPPLWGTNWRKEWTSSSPPPGGAACVRPEMCSATAASGASAAG